ncbi:hypothetical protein MHYP_G00207970 [Metynnis hypsauchen]
MTWIMQHNITDQLQKVTSLQKHFTYASKLPNPLCRALLTGESTGELPPSKIPPTPNMDYSHSYLLARGLAGRRWMLLEMFTSHEGISNAASGDARRQTAWFYKPQQEDGQLCW